MLRTIWLTPALTAALTLVLAAPQSASAAFSTGFEAPTYSTGALVGQDSWSLTSGVSPRVQTESEIAGELTAAGLTATGAVHSGSQAVLVTGSGSTSAIRPVSGLSASPTVVLDFWARPLTPVAAGSTIGTAVGNAFVTMEDSAGTRAAAVRFGGALSAGTITNNSIDVFTQGTGWISTGVNWQADVWYNLRLTADYTTQTYDVAIDGTTVKSDVTFYSINSEEFSQIRFFRGNNQAGMIVDDLTVAVPEPAGFALALMAACMIGVRRRTSQR